MRNWSQYACRASVCRNNDNHCHSLERKLKPCNCSNLTGFQLINQHEVAHLLLSTERTSFVCSFLSAGFGCCFLDGSLLHDSCYCDLVLPSCLLPTLLMTNVSSGVAVKECCGLQTAAYPWLTAALHECGKHIDITWEWLWAIFNWDSTEER